MGLLTMANLKAAFKRLLADNYRPLPPCTSCGEEATAVFGWYGGWICHACLMQELVKEAEHGPSACQG